MCLRDTSRSYGGSEFLQVCYEIHDVLLQLILICAFWQYTGILAQDEVVQRYLKQLGKLDEQVDRAPFFARLNAAVETSVNIQGLCDLFLCKAAFCAKLPDARSALFHVVIHSHDLQSQFLGENTF